MKRIGTHNGKFHADEALAIAMLQMLPEYQDAEIIRTRDSTILQEMDVVVDVGGVYNPAHHRYDHHQPTFTDTFGPVHSTLLSSAGLIYKHFGQRLIEKHFQAQPDHNQKTKSTEIASQYLWEKIYVVFIEPFDAHDNGISAYPADIKPKYHRPCTLFDQVSFINPAWNEPNVDVDVRFKMAVELMKNTFESVLKYYCQSWWPARTILKEAITIKDGDNLTNLDESNDRILILNQYCPWGEILFEMEAELIKEGHYLYVVFADSTGSGWRFQAVPQSPDSFLCRKPLPEGWRGKREAELDAVTGILGGVFVHRGGFIGGHQTREGAISMARLSINS